MLLIIKKRMCSSAVIVFILTITVCGALDYSEGTYRGITVSIDPQVPKDNCKKILDNLESALSSASAGVYKATGGRASWKSVTVLVPGNWPDSCVPSQLVVPSQGERADIKISLSHPVYRDMPWTQQTKPCGYQGDFIYLSYRLLIDQHHHDIGRVMVREWAKYRYGVFDETGYVADSVYPTCYRSDLKDDYQVNGCSDKDISENGVCSIEGALNISSLVNPEAKTSLLFTDSHRVDMFCDATSHDRFAPTKHNNLCRRKSAMQIINEHPDFSNGSTLSNDPINTTPTIIYKREVLTRYVLIIEDTKDMLIRESWSYLRLAVRKWLLVQLQGQVEVAIIAANETRATTLQRLTPLQTPASKDLLASNVPYTPGDSRAACLHCGVNMAYQLLKEREHQNGPASAVIVIVAPGTSDHVPELTEIVPRLKSAHIKVATITYPQKVRPRSLDWMAEETDGIAFTVMETKYNMMSSFISTYFRLTNVFSAIQHTFYQGDKAELPIEIHRKEIFDNGQTSVVGSFVLDDWLGEPAQFTVLTHNTENPLIRSITLVSPSHRVYSTRSDALLSLKLLVVPAVINETGTWTYTIERFPGSPQPHYVQVMATPRSISSPVVNARLYTARTQDDLIIYTEIKRGDYPVLGAKVEVSVTKQGLNGSLHRERFELMDTGSGDPDLMKGDGIYSRYFSAAMGGTGDYTFEVSVSDNGNTAYSWQYGHQYEGPLITRVSCCGSVIKPPSVESLSPFQRILPPITLHVVKSDAVSGMVADLRSVVLPSDLKARLTWTAPDMGGKPVTRYELRFAKSIGEILDSFNSGTLWPYGEPFALAPGSETTFTLDFTRNPSLLDQALYFAIRGYSDMSSTARPGPISNWVRVKVPSPPPPPPVTSTASTIQPIWPPQEESAIPNVAESFELNLEIILPVIVGLLILGILIIIYCYFCIKRRAKKAAKPDHPEKPLNVSIVPTENNSNTSNGNVSIQSNSNNYDTSPQLTTLPQYEVRVEEDHKRYSNAPYDGIITSNGQLTSPVYGSGNGQLSVINEYDNRNSTLLRDKTLSPYQSWSASQLLHEHERRQSPYGQMEDYNQYYPPPVPPLPAYQQDIYGANTHLPPPNQFMNYTPTQTIYSPSIQGSITSVNSNERKRRNVTMV